MKLPPEEQKAFEKYFEDLMYQASMAESSYKRGKIEGKQEGKLEGRLEGKLEEKYIIARNMKRKGIDVVVIAEISGLSVKEIEAL